MRLRLLPPTALVLVALLVPVQASAKNFRPGQLRICDEQRCVSIADQKVLNALARFFYGAPAPAEIRAPRLGASYLQIKGSNGYLVGIAATARLDRFRSRGMGLFGPDSWYRVPARAALALRTLAAGLQPLPVTPSTIARTRYG
jgi:hypothetical protein